MYNREIETSPTKAAANNKNQKEAAKRRLAGNAAWNKQYKTKK